MQELSTLVATQLATLKGKKDNITIDDIRGLLESFASNVGAGNAAEQFLRDEIIKIANHIQTTKNEILALAPDKTASDGNIGVAAVQLDAVIKATEEAAHNIMDAADELQNIMGASSASDADKQKMMEVAGRIYEACNFQDLTGQRIRKVMTALDFTESRIQRLINLFSSDGHISAETLAKATAPSNDNDGLLNGPQLPGQAPTQAEIDAMFGNLKN